MPLPPFPLTRPNEARPITGADSPPPPPPPSRHSPGPVPPERGRHPPRQQPGTTATAVSSPQPQTGNVVSARRHFRPAVSGSFSNGEGRGGDAPVGSKQRPPPAGGRRCCSGGGAEGGTSRLEGGSPLASRSRRRGAVSACRTVSPPPRREEPPSSASAAAGGRAAFPGAGFPSRHRRYSSPGVRKAPPEAGGWVGNPSGLL